MPGSWCCVGVGIDKLRSHRDREREGLLTGRPRKPACKEDKPSAQIGLSLHEKQLAKDRQLFGTRPCLRQEILRLAEFSRDGKEV